MCERCDRVLGQNVPGQCGVRCSPWLVCVYIYDWRAVTSDAHGARSLLPGLRCNVYWRGVGSDVARQHGCTCEVTYFAALTSIVDLSCLVCAPCLCG